MNRGTIEGEANICPMSIKECVLVTLDDIVGLRTKVFQKGMVIRGSRDDEFFRQFVSYR